jgi:hypothetical protein
MDLSVDVKTLIVQHVSLPCHHEAFHCTPTPTLSPALV